MPTVEISKLLGVSDVAIGKRCKVRGLTKPPVGYWRKFETNKLDESEKLDTFKISRSFLFPKQ